MIINLKWFRIIFEIEKLPGIHEKCLNCNKYTHIICLEGYEKCKCGWEEEQDLFAEIGGWETEETCPKCGKQKLFTNKQGDIWCNYPCDYVIYANGYIIPDNKEE
jgi:hypothetical protein